MLKQLTAIVFLIAFVTHTFNRAVIVIDYYFNVSAYAKNCENKSRPQMHCNGKCHMMKMLKQEEKKDQENPERKMENKFEIVCFSAQQNDFELYHTITRISYPVYRENISTGFISSFFHPPQV